MVKIRLEGLPESVDAMIDVMRQAGFEILQESKIYHNRGGVYVRKYLEVNQNACDLDR